MFVPGEATILHADLDAFFASVEQRDDPRLRGKPVIVGAGVVLAASYEAKAYGIETAMGGRRARQLCPHAEVVPPRMSAYAEASKAVYRVFDDMSPLVEGLSIDEAFLDVRGMERIAGTPADIATRLRQRVFEEVGLPLTVGVARTKFLAKVASGVAKPDGLLVVPPDGELAFLHPLPVERLWGVGRVTAAKLHERGITNRGPGRLARREGARRPARASRRPPSARAGPQPRPASSPSRPATGIDRLPTSPRPLEDAEITARDRRDPPWPSRPSNAPDAKGRPSRPHSDAPPALRRLHKSNALAHAVEADRRDVGDPRNSALATHDGAPAHRTAGPNAGRDNGRRARERRRSPAPPPAPTHTEAP